MVEYIDTMVIAQLGTPDMRHCVRYALSYPERMRVDESGLDFYALSKLTFDKPDTEAFPLLDTARAAYKMGTTAPAALIAADEEAVAAFIRGDIGFKPHASLGADEVFEAEREGRRLARKLIGKICNN